MTFTGCPGWCNPFAAGKEMVFIPNLRKDMAVEVEVTEYGLQLGKKTDPRSDTVVLLGGGVLQCQKSARQILSVCVGGVF
ncbi:MAG: DUF2124 family protein [Candidatus Methanoperedens sp.]|nr:DUF2124 family protein [Candidatus Methanoperedens sp.]